MLTIRSRLTIFFPIFWLRNEINFSESICNSDASEEDIAETFKTPLEKEIGWQRLSPHFSTRKQIWALSAVSERPLWANRCFKILSNFSIEIVPKITKVQVTRYR